MLWWMAFCILVDSDHEKVLSTAHTPCSTVFDHSLWTHTTLTSNTCPYGPPSLLTTHGVSASLSSPLLSLKLWRPTVVLTSRKWVLILVIPSVVHTWKTNTTRADVKPWSPKSTPHIGSIAGNQFKTRMWVLVVCLWWRWGLKSDSRGGGV